jgi:hypothetical protein
MSRCGRRALGPPSRRISSPVAPMRGQPPRIPGHTPSTWTSLVLDPGPDWARGLRHGRIVQLAGGSLVAHPLVVVGGVLRAGELAASEDLAPAPSLELNQGPFPGVAHLDLQPAGPNAYAGADPFGGQLPVQLPGVVIDRQEDTGRASHGSTLGEQEFDLKVARGPVRRDDVGVVDASQQSPQAPPPPPHLGPGGRRFWRHMTAELHFGPHEIPILTQAARLVDRLDKLSELAAKEPPTLRGSRGSAAPNPVLDAERRYTASLAALMRQLAPQADKAGSMSDWGRAAARRRWSQRTPRPPTDPPGPRLVS